MTYFLEQVANQLYGNNGADFNNHCLVFPNRRAGLFFMKHLAAKAGKPLWAPHITTINDLFISSSRYRLASRESLVFELFRQYRTLAKSEETFDNFYFWGEMLVNDFDDVDKYLVDAGALFTNIADLHAIDEQFGGMTPEQMAVIRKFIENFRAGSETDQKRDFEFTWSVLFPLYEAFRASLSEKGLAYEGMIFRELIGDEELLSALLNKYAAFHFIGFNALNSCEMKLMKYLRKEERALFYWDYHDSVFFREDTKSGFFIVPNIKEFGQDLILPDEIDSSASGNNGSVPEISIIDIPSDAGQAKLLPHLLSGFQKSVTNNMWHRSAVILADENLLPAVISSVPSDITDINITMGYPFSMTVVYSFLKSLLELQSRPLKYGDSYMFDYRKVLPVLTNPLVARSAGNAAPGKSRELISRNVGMVPSSFFDDDSFLRSLFMVADDASGLCNYLREILLSITSALHEASAEKNGEPVLKDPLTPEFLYRANQMLNRLEPLLSDTDVTISRETFIRLSDRIFREIKVPFRGEPLQGLQIMGLLESRALDFDNIIVLSANEGVLPKTNPSSSYIPYSLREAFGLPTITHQDSIYSYYFTRLLNRANNITLVYNSSSEGLRSGEMSRFLLRLKYTGSIKPEFTSAYTRMSRRITIPEERGRTETDILALENLYLNSEKPTSLSPSAINTWLNCSMKFYYAYVCGLREPDRITASIDPAKFGTILHEVVSRVYKPFEGEVVTVELIKGIRSNSMASQQIIKEVLQTVYYGGTGIPVTGTGLVTTDIVNMFLNKVLTIDTKFAPFTVIGLEESFSTGLTISYNNVSHKVRVGGKIDRIDEVEGVRRLIDYKTGSAVVDIGTLEELFDTEKSKLNNAVTQTMIYCVIMLGKEGYLKLRPVIYGLRGSASGDFIDKILLAGEPVDDFNAVSDPFNGLLIHALEQIFDKERPFRMTTINERCGYCPYKRLCQR